VLIVVELGETVAGAFSPTLAGPNCLNKHVSKLQVSKAFCARNSRATGKTHKLAAGLARLHEGASALADSASAGADILTHAEGHGYPLTGHQIVCACRKTNMALVVHVS
jgi:X-X-X-Leu-X-X-Gly heptad repeat protein